MPIFKHDGDGQELDRKPQIHRLGIIRLGTLETGQKDGREYTYPQASDHFILKDAPEVAEYYKGEDVTVLDNLIIPLEDEDVVAAHYLRMYSGNNKLLCMGDNRLAKRWVDGDRLKATGDLAPAEHDAKNPIRKEISCPCAFLDTGRCRESLYFRFALPNIPGVGVWQLRTTSPNSIAQLQGCISLVRAITGGRVAGIPLKLSLVRTEMHSVKRGGMVTVYLLKLEVSGDITIPQLAAMGENRAALPAPGRSAIDADYDEEENHDPEMTGWTSNEDLAAAESPAEASEEALTEADFVEPPARTPAPTSPAPAPAKGRGQRQRQNQPAGPAPMDELKSDRQALSELIKGVVPSVDVVPEDLARWFNGKNRITQLTLEEMNRAGPLFRKEYPAQEPAPAQ